jgi:hypothetical protein
VLGLAVWPISGVQLVTQLALLLPRLNRRGRKAALGTQ